MYPMEPVKMMAEPTHNLYENIHFKPVRSQVLDFCDKYDDWVGHYALIKRSNKYDCVYLRRYSNYYFLCYSILYNFNYEIDVSNIQESLIFKDYWYCPF